MLLGNRSQCLPNAVLRHMALRGQRFLVPVAGRGWFCLALLDVVNSVLFGSAR